MLYRFIFLSLFLIVTSGCATGPQIPIDQLKDFAVLLPRQNNSIISKLNDENQSFSTAGKPVNIRPGKWKIETFSCYGGAISGSANCRSDVYITNIKAGFAYVFMGKDEVEVYDRFNMDKLKIDHLKILNGREFITSVEYGQIQQQRKKQADEDIVIANLVRERAREIEQKKSADDAITSFNKRKKNIPLIRKIGAKICQEQKQVVFVGYVEAMTDEKVKINIADAYSARTRIQIPNFVPTTIWEPPILWDICE